MPRAATHTEISSADLEQRLFLIAADSMMGREPGGAGNFKTAEYVANEFRRLRLRPAGDNGSYFQTVPFFRATASASHVDVNGVPLALGRDFLPISLGAGARSLAGAHAIYGGSVADSSHWPTAEQAKGNLVVLEEQDRSAWNQEQIAEALPMVEESLRLAPGPYALQAAIAAEHCKPARAMDTNWRRITTLYELLERLQPSPIVALNRAVAIAMAGDLEGGLDLINSLIGAGQLEDYHLIYAARADLLRRKGESAAAAESYEQALGLVTNESERRFLDRRLREVRVS
jgi:tetratricopeptide (TPR) repeat protein